MRKPILAVLLILIALVPAPAPAQAVPRALDWVPADFDGALRVDLEDTTAALQDLNLALYVASFLQPARLTADTLRGFEDFFPVTLFDSEAATFASTVLPWLDGEIVIAYRDLSRAPAVPAEDILLVLPTADALGAAAALQPVLTAQDTLRRETHRGIPVYVGDRTTFAFTPVAVLAGDETVVRAALDAGLTGAERLVDTDGYRALALDAETAPLVAYFRGDAVPPVLSAALQGDTSAEPLLRAFGSALQAAGVGGAEPALLAGDLGGVAVALVPDAILRRVRATIRLSAPAADPDGGPAFNPDVLNLVPRRAMVVQSGADARGALAAALRILPMTGYLFDVFGAFLLAPGTQLPPGPPVPSADDLDAAVAGFRDALADAGGLDLDDDLEAYLTGSYAVALLPRPNNPAPRADSPYDLLLVVESDDAAAAADGARALAWRVLSVDDSAIESVTLDGRPFATLYARPGDPALQIGAAEEWLIVGTGTAPAEALRAARGDNRLTATERWRALSEDAPPSLYVDLNSLYSTFFPAPGGPVSRGIGQLGARVRALDGGQTELAVTVTLPAGP